MSKAPSITAKRVKRAKTAGAAIAVAVYVLTPSGEAEVAKLDADVASVISSAKSTVAADATKVSTAVADIKKI